MSANEDGEFPGTRLRKHRHDLGHEDHGPKLAAATTRAIQILLGLWIALTLVLVVYALVGPDRIERSPGRHAGPEPNRSIPVRRAARNGITLRRGSPLRGGAVGPDQRREGRPENNGRRRGVRAGRARAVPDRGVGRWHGA